MIDSTPDEMKHWWSAIPAGVRTMVAILAAVSFGLALTPWVQLPARVERVEAQIDALDSQLSTLIEQVNRYICVQLADSQGYSPLGCISTGVLDSNTEIVVPPGSVGSRPPTNSNDG